MQLLTLAAATVFTGIIISAHPGHDIKQELAERAPFLQNGKRDISHCAELLKTRGIERQTIERRSKTLRAERENRGLPTSTSI